MIGLPLSSPVCGLAWKLMAKSFSVSGFAVAADATQCSGSARTVIEDSAIAASPAVPKRDASSDAVPTVVTNAAQKAGSTIATGSASIATASRKHA